MFGNASDLNFKRARCGVLKRTLWVPGVIRSFNLANKLSSNGYEKSRALTELSPCSMEQGAAPA